MKRLIITIAEPHRDRFIERVIISPVFTDGDGSAMRAMLSTIAELADIGLLDGQLRGVNFEDVHKPETIPSNETQTPTNRS